MKKITLLLLLFVSTAFYAQSSGISYQAIIYNPNGEVIPGYNNSNSPLANKNICLQFTIIDSEVELVDCRCSCSWIDSCCGFKYN